MKLPDAAQENLSFLFAELDGQLASLLAYIDAPGAAAAQSLICRAGYSHNLASRVRKSCLFGMYSGKRSATRDLQLEGIETVARNLDLVSRLCRRAVQHAETAGNPELLSFAAYRKPVKQVRRAVASAQQALQSSDSRMAVRIGQTRSELTVFHDQLFETYTQDMQGQVRAAALAHGLLALNEVSRMGEALEAIGAAILSINIGQPVQFERYFALRSVLAKVDGDGLRLRPLAETRSGSAIAGVSLRDGNGLSVEAVLKEGDHRKVKEERIGVKSWNSVYPGLAPEILSYKKRGDSAALLIEHLDGETFEDIVLGGSDAELTRAQKALHKTVRDIWRQTRSAEPAEMEAMAQLGKRLGDVYRLHPKFETGHQTIQGVRVPSFDALVAAARKREAKVKAPFSVYIHGDFNLDNVLYDPAENKIRFIDLHRSRYMDYVQDVSVFMVSNYRLQVLDAEVRARIAGVALDMHAMAAKFARSQQDPTFEYRLALGLARSFASSTRFIVDRDHARGMFLRARYILQTALAVPEGKEARFRLPMRKLFSD